MNNGNLIILVGASGVGKTTIMKKLIEIFKNKLNFYPTYTTREKRNYEKNGIDYFVLRSESAKVYGGDLIFAYQLTNPQFTGLVEVFFGISYRKRIRDYNTIATYRDKSYNPYYDKDHPLGTFHDEEEYPLLTAGFKIGLNTFFK